MKSFCALGCVRMHENTVGSEQFHSMQHNPYNLARHNSECCHARQCDPAKGLSSPPEESLVANMAKLADE